MKIHHRNMHILLTLIAALLIISSWLTVWRDLQHDKQQQITSAIEGNKKLVNAFAEHVGRTVQDVDTLLLYIKNQYEKSGGYDEDAAVLVGYARQNKAIKSFIVADSNGNVVGSMAAGSGEIASVVVLDQFKAHIEKDTGELYFSKPTIELAKWSFSISRRINKPDGSFGGAVMVALDSDYFANFYDDMKLNDYQGITLVGQDGYIRMRQYKQDKAGNINVSDKPIFKAMVDDPDRTYVGVGFVRNVPRIFNFGKMAEYPLYIAVGTTEEDVLAPYYSRRNMMVGINSVVSIILIATFWAIGRAYRAQADLTLAKARQALLIDLAPVGVHEYELGAKGALIFAGYNKAADRILGTDHSLYLGREMEEIFPSSKENGIAAACRARLNGRKIADSVDVFHESPASEMVFEVSLIPIADRRIGVFFHDVSQRRYMEKQLRSSEENLRQIIETVPIAVVLVKMSDNTVSYANQKCLEIFCGTTDDRFIGRNSKDLWADNEERTKYMTKLTGEGDVRYLEIKMKRLNGMEFWALISTVIIEYEGARVSLSSINDIQQRKELEIKLLESEVRFRRIVETTPVPIILTKLDDNTVIYINAEGADTFSLPAGAIIGRPVGQFFDNPGDARNLIDDITAGKLIRNKELLLKDGEGRRVWAMVSSELIEYNSEKVVLSTIYDISKHKNLENELKHLATTDHLTGAINRRLLLELAEFEFNRQRRYKTSLTVLVLDIDYFKKINDTYGHRVGDEALISFVKICTEVIRSVDVLGRMGGEEFAILLTDTDLAGGIQVAERLRLSVCQTPLKVNDKTIYMTVSIGVADITPEDETFGDVYNRADKALYIAKRQGRNRVVG